ncbi:MAG: PspA-associated protein PspAB [Actinomycetales bacterium]
MLDKILGRSKPVAPNLDQLFAVPSAAITLETTVGLVPTGLGSVCFRAPEGAAFDALEREVRALLDADGGPPVELSQDSYGYTWILARHDPSDAAAVGDLVTELHGVNSSLVDAGFGPTLLCSLVGFADPAPTGTAPTGAGGRRLGLVYLFKRGTFYPFAPAPGGEERRDNSLELQVRAALANDLRVEDDVSRWFPVWGAPGL